MKKQLIKFTVTLSLMMSFIGATVFAALPNMYGKNYSQSKNGKICSITAFGDKDFAKTSIKNTTNGTRYYSAYVNRRHSKDNAVIESDCKEQLVKSGKFIEVSVARYRSTAGREHYHKAISWNCTMKPSGAGYTDFKADEWSYTIKQEK